MSRASAWFRPPTLALSLVALVAIVVGLSGAGGEVREVREPGSVDGCSGSADWSALIREHARRYPLMEAADLYKLLHQATLGSEHAVPDRAAPAEWLRAELSELGEGPAEPLVDPLGDASRVARVHLRAFMAGAGDPERLLDAFVETATTVPPDHGSLGCALEAAIRIAADNDLAWEVNDLAGFASEQAEEAYPPVHHSDAFARAYRPAYRVISIDLVPFAVRGVQR